MKREFLSNQTRTKILQQPGIELDTVALELRLPIAKPVSHSDLMAGKESREKEGDPVLDRLP